MALTTLMALQTLRVLMLLGRGGDERLCSLELERVGARHSTSCELMTTLMLTCTYSIY